jgi:hypothetical protein
MQYVSQIAFLVIVGIATYFLYKRISQIRKNIFLGKKAERNDQSATRWKTMLLGRLWTTENV